jgi:multisubunit Na+/H+ antiporter MnhE subunit
MAKPSVRGKFLRWLTWWIVLTGFWLMIDDQVRADEVLFGVAAAGLAALLVAGVRDEPGRLPRVRLSWLTEAAQLPGRVASDTVTVFAALYRWLARRELPGGGYAEIPVRYGEEGPRGHGRRVAVTWAYSLAPNRFAVAMAPGRDVMLVHQLSGDNSKMPEAG